MNTWQKLKANPDLWPRYFLRETLLKSIRRFFDDQQFHEVETPILLGHAPAESYLQPLATIIETRQHTSQHAYLATSPEIALKKLLVAGIGNCYSITKTFRNNETPSQLHSTEFTMIEWYRVSAGIADMMRDCETLVLSLYRDIQDTHHTQERTNLLTYQGKRIDLTAPWERMTVAEAFHRWAGIDLGKFLQYDVACAMAMEKGYIVGANTTWEQLFHQIFLNEIEPHLGLEKPVILYEYPAGMAAMVAPKEEDMRFCDRFEVYIAGLELANCYRELTDGKEQEKRLQEEVEKIAKERNIVASYDMDFIEAMNVGLPACSGIALGIDRLIMLFADVADIADIQFFPEREI